MKSVAGLTAAVVLAAVYAGSAGAAIVNVDCSKHDLQRKIDAAPAGSTLRVKGICRGQFTIDKSLTVDGTPSASLDGVERGRPLTIDTAPTVRLLDLMITGGHVLGTAADGGGIKHDGGSLVLRRVVVAGNRAEAIAPAGLGGSAVGGGIFSLGSNLALYDSSVRNNTATLSSLGSGSAVGGGIYRHGRLRLDHSSLIGNRAGAAAAQESVAAFGGGLYIWDTALRVISSRVADNRAAARGAGSVSNASAWGGGVYVYGASSVTLSRSTFDRNLAVAFGPGGGVTAGGGAVNGSLPTVVVERSVLTGNEARATSSASAVTAATGGAFLVQSTRFELVRSRIADSLAHAESGGFADAAAGAATHSGGQLLVRRSRLTSNRAIAAAGTEIGTARAGGLWAGGSSLRVERSTLDANVARASGQSTTTASGGGLDASGGSIALVASTVSRNIASSGSNSLGGGIWISSPSAHTITSSTVALNRAGGATARGGGIDTSSDLSIRSSTVARNQAKLGGGIYVEGGTTTIKATAIGQNRGPGAPDCGGPLESAGWNLIGNLTGCSFVEFRAEKRNLPTRLGPLASNGGPTQTILPLAGSPALNWVPDAQCPPRDQRGVRRPQGPKCEIGAVERRPGSRP